MNNLWTPALSLSKKIDDLLSSTLNSEPSRAWDRSAARGMSSRKELHVLLRGVEQLRVPGRPSDETFDVYALISCGHQQHRSRLIEHTASPDWNEEFVFDGSRVSPDDVVKVEVFNQGLFQDELLFNAYLQLSYCASLEEDEPPNTSPAAKQQQQQQLVSFTTTSSSSSRPAGRSRGCEPAGRFRPSTRGVLEEEEEEGEGEQAAARLGASSSSQQAPAAPAPAAAAAAVARMSDVTTEALALLSASKLVGGSSSSSSASGRLRSVGGSSRAGHSLSKLRLKRSTHVRSAADLVVSVWWVLQPPVVDTGVPPCVLSFVHAPGVPHALPSATHTDIASLWEEPCLAFVRLVVSTVNLGPAAAAAQSARLSGPAGGSSSGGGGSSSAAAAAGGGGGGGRKGSKVVLRRLTGLLKGDAAAAEEVAAAAAACSSDDETASALLGRRAPTLTDIHGAGSLAASFRAAGGGPGGLTQFDWQALDDIPSDDDTEAAASTVEGSGASSSSLSHWGLSSRQQRRSSSDNAAAGHKQGGATSSSSRRDDKPLHLSVKIQLGDLEPQALKPVPLNPDGSAAVHQAAVFVVPRPLEEAVITYRLGLQRGARGSPLLVLVFQYSLLHLLRRSPPHSYSWEEWRRVAHATVAGLQVPLPVLPMASLGLSAFLADADCRAGMYQVPPVSAGALAAAAADDAAAAAAAAAEAEAAAEAAAVAAAAADSDTSLTDSDSTSDIPPAAGDIAYDYVLMGGKGAAGQQQQHGVSSSAGAGPSYRPGVRPGGVLRRRASPGSAAAAAAEAEAAAAAAKGPARPHLDKWRSRMLSGVEAGLNTAMERLPENVAEKVKGRFINRLFPRAQRSEVFSIGQLRVLSTKHGLPSATRQQQQQPVSPAGSRTPPSPFHTSQQQQQQLPRPVGTGLLSARTGAEHAAAVAAAAAAAARQAAAVVPLEDHPNVATAGDPAAGPLGVLALTLQGINLRRGRLSAGYSLLLKSGPHWLELSPSALPLTIYSSSSSSTAGGSGEARAARGETNKAPPLQVLLPVYGSSCLVALVLHRCSAVVGRCVFRLYGLLPLLLRDYSKSLTLYSDKRGPGGGRVIAGSVLLHLSAIPGPDSSWLRTLLRLGCSFLITPHTLSLHTSGVLESVGRDERAAAAGRVVSEWLADQGQAVVPDSLVSQLVSTGRNALSSRSMKGHVRRMKAVLLDWLPRRLDPLAFYYWRRPLHNLLALWVLSHACLYPGHWLLAISLLLTAVLLWRITIQVHQGVLGFEMEQLLPPEIGASLADLQQQQAAGDSADDLSDAGSSAGGSASDLASQLRGGPASAQLGERVRYKEAAERIRGAVAAGRQELRNKLHASTGGGQQAQTEPPTAKLPTSLAELRQQLEAGTLSLDALDIEAAAQQLLSVGGLLKLARKHSTYLLEYALVAQNLLDDAAGFAEGLYAMATAQDPLAALLLCGVLLAAASFCHFAGLGAGVWVLIAVLLRPPIMRGVPGVFGWKACLAHLRGHGRSLEELAW